MSDAKEWVTVKVPKEVRDDAREDPRTYGEIMRAGLGTNTNDADAEALADAVADRLEGSKPIEDMAFEDWFEPDYAMTIARQLNAELLEGDLSKQLDRIESAATTAEDRTGDIQRTLEGLR